MLGSVSSHYTTSRSNSDPHIDAIMKTHAAMDEEELKQKAKMLDPSKPANYQSHFQLQPTTVIRRPTSPTAAPKNTPTSSAPKVSAVVKSAPPSIKAPHVQQQQQQQQPKPISKPETPPLTPSLTKSPTSTQPISKQPIKPSPSEPATAPAKRRADESMQAQEATRRKVSSLESDNTTEADYKEKLALLYPRIDSEVRSGIGFDQFPNTIHRKHESSMRASCLSCGRYSTPCWPPSPASTTHSRYYADASVCIGFMFVVRRHRRRSGGWSWVAVRRPSTLTPG